MINLLEVRNLLYFIFFVVALLWFRNLEQRIRKLEKKNKRKKVK